jgi:hypothetical protein
MDAPISSSTKTAGFWSAVLATAFSVTYVLAQIAEWSGLLGSQGGPESSSTLLGIVVLLTPSLFLAASFLALVASIHQVTSPDQKIWSQLAVALAPRIAGGRTQGIEAFLFVPFDSFLYAADVLGYCFMSAATLFAAAAFGQKGDERVVHLFLMANGLLLPFIALQMYFHSLIWIAALWAVTFPGSTWSLAILFRRATATDAT